MKVVRGRFNKFHDSSAACKNRITFFFKKRKKIINDDSTVLTTIQDGG